MIISVNADEYIWQNSISIYDKNSHQEEKNKPLIKVNIEGTYLNIIKTIYDKSTANSKNLLFVLAPLWCSRDPNKALLEFLVWTLVSFHLLGKAKSPGQYPIYGTQRGTVVPFWEEDLGTSGSIEHSFPLGDKWPLEPLVSASPCLLRLPSQPLEASGPSFTKCFPLPLFFPTPGSSLFLPPLSFPLSVPTYSCPILLREWTLGGYSIPPLRLWDLPPLVGNGSPWRMTSRGGRGLPHTMQPLVQQILPCERLMRAIEVYSV